MIHQSGNCDGQLDRPRQTGKVLLVGNKSKKQTQGSWALPALTPARLSLNLLVKITIGPNRESSEASCPVHRRKSAAREKRESPVS